MLALIYATTATGAFYAFTDWTGIGDFNFVGLDNFAKIFRTSELTGALVNTLILAFGFVLCAILETIGYLNLVSFLANGPVWLYRVPMSWMVSRTLLGVLLLAALVVERHMPTSRQPAVRDVRVFVRSRKARTLLCGRAWSRSASPSWASNSRVGGWTVSPFMTWTAVTLPPTLPVRVRSLVSTDAGSTGWLKFTSYG